MAPQDTVTSCPGEVALLGPGAEVQPEACTIIGLAALRVQTGVTTSLTVLYRGDVGKS